MTHVGILLLWVHGPVGGAKKHAYTLKLILGITPLWVAERVNQQVHELIEVHCDSDGDTAAFSNGGGVVSEFRLTGDVVKMRTRSKLNRYSAIGKSMRARCLCA